MKKYIIHYYDNIKQREDELMLGVETETSSFSITSQHLKDFPELRTLPISPLSLPPLISYHYTVYELDPNGEIREDLDEVNELICDGDPLSDGEMAEFVTYTFLATDRYKEQNWVHLGTYDYEDWKYILFGTEENETESKKERERTL